jgi:hypothetical protein
VQEPRAPRLPPGQYQQQQQEQQRQQEEQEGVKEENGQEAALLWHQEKCVYNE